MINYINTLVGLTKEQLEALRLLTFERRTSRSELIRKALDEWLIRQEEVKDVIL